VILPVAGNPPPTTSFGHFLSSEEMNPKVDVRWVPRVEQAELDRFLKQKLKPRLATLG